jgi:hypothetical protein
MCPGVQEHPSASFMLNPVIQAEYYPPETGK